MHYMQHNNIVRIHESCLAVKNKNGQWTLSPYKRDESNELRATLSTRSRDEMNADDFQEEETASDVLPEIILPMYLKQQFDNIQQNQLHDVSYLRQYIDIQRYLDHVDQGQVDYLEPLQLQALYMPFDPLSPSSYIVMDYAPNLSLFQYISRKRLSMNATVYYLNQLVDALHYMMKQRLICHRDLKPENFLIDQNFDIQLADFGFCSRTQSETKSKSQSQEMFNGQLQDSDENSKATANEKLHFTCRGTFQYMAPEIYDAKLCNKGYNPE